MERVSPNKLSNTVQILTSTALRVKSIAAALLRDSAERPNGIRPKYAGRAVGKKPVIGSLAVQNVDTERVLKILQSIWATKPETAGRLRGRIVNILDRAEARGYRDRGNPARWQGHLKQLLPTFSTRERAKHHKAMPFAEVPQFVERLRERAAVSARYPEFTILTAARINDAANARAEDIDLANVSAGAGWNTGAPSAPV